MSKMNPEKLEKVTKTLPVYVKDVKDNLKEIEKKANEILSVFEKINELLDETELINARGIKPYDEEMRFFVGKLLDNDTLDGYLMQVSDCEEVLDNLTRYYEDRYKKTVNRLNR